MINPRRAAGPYGRAYVGRGRRDRTRAGHGGSALSGDREAIVAAGARRAGGYRWVICGLLFAATAINYIDRQMIGVLKPLLQVDLGWSEGQYADIVFWFQAAYAL